MIFQNHKCSCNKEYTPEDWESLECIGFVQYGDSPWLEFRNCTCGSTMTEPCEELYG